MAFKESKDERKSGNLGLGFVSTIAAGTADNQRALWSSGLRGGGRHREGGTGRAKALLHDAKPTLLEGFLVGMSRGTLASSKLCVSKMKRSNFRSMGL